MKVKWRGYVTGKNLKRRASDVIVTLRRSYLTVLLIKEDILPFRPFLLGNSPHPGAISIEEMRLMDGLEAKNNPPPVSKPGQRIRRVNNRSPGWIAGQLLILISVNVISGTSGSNKSRTLRWHPSQSSELLENT